MTSPARPRSSLAAQIAEVRREIDMRGHVYPGLVARGRMRQSEADLCTDRMRDVLATLQWLQRHEPSIRRLLADEGGET